MKTTGTPAASVLMLLSVSNSTSAAAAPCTDMQWLMPGKLWMEPSSWLKHCNTPGLVKSSNVYLFKCDIQE
jgi:hypothetical protein